MWVQAFQYKVNKIQQPVYVTNCWWRPWSAVTRPCFHLEKQMIIAWSQIRTVGRVVYNIPAKNIQSFLLSKAVCGLALSWRRTTQDVNIPLCLFWIVLSFFRVLVWTSAFIVVPLCKKYTKITPFLSQNTVTMSLRELSCC